MSDPTLPGYVLHTIPVGQKHTLSKHCKCKPKVERNKATIVHHRPGRGYRGLYRIRFQKGKLR